MDSQVISIVTNAENLRRKMTDWHNEIHEELGWFSSKNPLCEGHQIDSNCCDKCDTSGEWPSEQEHDKIETYEAKNYSIGCRICGTITGEHGFSFSSRTVE